MSTITRLHDAALIRARRASAALGERAAMAAECVRMRALDRGLSLGLAQRCADLARDAVIAGRQSPGRAIGAGYTRAQRLRRHALPGGVA